MDPRLKPKGSSTVNFATMAYVKNTHFASIVVDFVEDTVLPNSDSPALM